MGRGRAASFYSIHGRATTRRCRRTHPAILGFGRPLFDDYDVPIELDLLEQRSFNQGVTMHRYALRDVKEASSC